MHAPGKTLICRRSVCVALEDFVKFFDVIPDKSQHFAFITVWFGRIKDFLGFLPFVLRLPPSLRDAVISFFGFNNLFDDSACVGSYSLDFRFADHRYVMQQLMWLVEEEK